MREGRGRMASSQARAGVRADIGGCEFNSQTSVPQEEVGVNVLDARRGCSFIV